MTKVLATTRLAKDYNRAMHLYMQDVVGNYNATQWSPTPASTSVPDTNGGGTKDALCSTFNTNWDNNAPWVWSFTKNAGNPLIAQQYGAQFEFYPPYPLQDGSALRLLAKCNGESYGYSNDSGDGVTWVSDGLFIPKGIAGTWNDIQCSVNVLRKVGSTYYAFANGYGDSPVFNHKLGIWTNTTWDSNFVANVGNPVYTPSAYNAANNTSWDGININDTILVGNRWYFFGCVFNNAESSGALCYGIGPENGSITDIVLDTKIGNFSDFNSVWAWSQGLSVFKHPVTGKWIATFTLGNLTQTGTDNQAIYCLYSNRTDAPIFTIDDFICKPILYPNTANAFEDNYNYDANWITDNEGNLIPLGANYGMYFSAHQTGASPTYTGVCCLATCASIPQI